MGGRARAARSFVIGAVAMLALLGGCATAPFYRPMGPPMDNDVVECGIGAHADFGSDQMGVGTAGWLQAQVLPDFELVLRGHGTDFFSYAGTGQPFDDVLFGGSAGIRGIYHFSPTLLLGGEALVDYEQRTGPEHEQLVSGIVGIPVAEAATPDLWVYTDISLGIAVPLNRDAAVPFFGFQEIPLGVAWRATPWLLVVGEGGVSLPVNGGYVGVAAAFRL